MSLCGIFWARFAEGRYGVFLAVRLSSKFGSITRVVALVTGIDLKEIKHPDHIQAGQATAMKVSRDRCRTTGRQFTRQETWPKILFQKGLPE